MVLSSVGSLQPSLSLSFPVGKIGMITPALFLCHPDGRDHERRSRIWKHLSSTFQKYVRQRGARRLRMEKAGLPPPFPPQLRTWISLTSQGREGSSEGGRALAFFPQFLPVRSRAEKMSLSTTIYFSYLVQFLNQEIFEIPPFSFPSYINKVQGTGWLKTTEMYPLTALEAGGLNSRCPQGDAALKPTGEGRPFLASSSSWCCWQSLACGCI